MTPTAAAAILGFVLILLKNKPKNVKTPSGVKTSNAISIYFAGSILSLISIISNITTETTQKIANILAVI